MGCAVAHPPAVGIVLVTLRIYVVRVVGNRRISTSTIVPAAPLVGVKVIFPADPANATGATQISDRLIAHTSRSAPSAETTMLIIAKRRCWPPITCYIPLPQRKSLGAIGLVFNRSASLVCGDTIQEKKRAVNSAIAPMLNGSFVLSSR